MKRNVTALLFATLALALPLTAAAEGDYTLTLKNHKFSPADMVLPQGKRLKLTIINQDKTPAEFESDDLDVEKVVAGGQSISVFVGPLKPGSYSFYDEYHEDESEASLTVK